MSGSILLDKTIWLVSVIGTGSTVYSIIFSLFFAFGLLIWIFRKELRLFSNIRRKVIIINSTGNSMESEAHLLKHVGFFRIDGPVADFAIDYLTKHTLVIIGWSAGMSNFAEIFDAAKSKNLPIIVYSNGGRLEGADLALVRSYSFALICEFKLRLINDVFGILSTFKHVG